MSAQKQTPQARLVATTKNLQRSLGRVDMIFLTIAATIGIDTIAQIAGTGGAQSFTWAVVLVVTFMFPYALVTAELGSTFAQEGGPYVWVRLAFGKFAAAISTMFYWVTNPIWLGGSLAFISVSTWSTYIAQIDEGSPADYVFKLSFVWVAIGISIISLRFGKQLLSAGAISKVLLLFVFVVTVAIYAFKNGIHGYAAGEFSPTLGGFLSVTPVLLFAFVGLEAQNGAAEEMKNPQRDVPKSVAVSGIVSALCYLVPIYAILAVLPPSKISGASGFLDAVTTVFSVYGEASEGLLKLVALVFIFIVLTQGSAWMIASDRVQASAGGDGAFPRWFGKFNAKLGTPVRVNLLSGIVASVFTIAATSLVVGSAASLFAVVLTIAISTLLLSYLLILPSIIRLRMRFPLEYRPYRVPGGKVGVWICASVLFAWIALGSWVAVFPGTIEGVFGISYPFEEIWGVSRLNFEMFTLGTLLIITALAVGGFFWARVRDGRDGNR